MSPAKPAEPIEMPFGGLTHVGTRKHVLGLHVGVGMDQIRTNPFAAARGDNMPMRPFVKIL